MLRRLVRSLFFSVLAISVAAAAGQPKHPSRLKIDRGVLYTSTGVPIDLRGVEALISAGSSDDGKSMGGKVVQILHGSVVLSYDALSRLLNAKLDDGKVKDLKVSSDKGQIKIHGTVTKVIPLPFDVKGPVTVTPDGRLDLHASSEKAAKIPIGGIADALGLNMQKVVGKGNHKGVKADKQDVIFDPDQLWGLPVHGKVTRARVESKALVLTFGGDATPSRSRQALHTAGHH